MRLCPSVSFGSLVSWGDRLPLRDRKAITMIVLLTLGLASIASMAGAKNVGEQTIDQQITAPPGRLLRIWKKGEINQTVLAMAVSWRQLPQGIIKELLDTGEINGIIEGSLLGTAASKMFNVTVSLFDGINTVQMSFELEINANGTEHDGKDANENGKYDPGEDFGDDVGTDGVSPHDLNYTEPDANGTECNHRPDFIEGLGSEPDFGPLDVPNRTCWD